MDNDIQICSVKMKYYVRFVMDKKNLSYERTLHWNKLETIYQLLTISQECNMITKVYKYNWAFENMNAYFHDV